MAKKTTKNASPEFLEMVRPLRDAYDNIVVKKNKKYIYKGPGLRSTVLIKGCASLDQSLTVKKIGENAITDAVTEIIGAAVQLGMQKGLDIAAERTISSNSAMLTSVEMIELLLKAKKPDVEAIRRSLSTMKKQLRMRNNSLKKELNPDE